MLFIQLMLIAFLFPGYDEGAVEAGGEMPLWRQLDAMSPAEKDNAVIRFEALTDLPRDVIGETVEIEKLWENGEFDGAIERLKPLAASHLAAAIHWKTPIPTALPGDGADVQVDVRGDVFGTHLDFHAGSGNLFAVLRRGQSDSPRWTVNLSTDNGLSWSETFSWGATYDVAHTSAVVVADSLYIAYAPDDGSTSYPSARIRRCSAINGLSDIGYGFKTVFDKGIDIKEVALVSNADTSNSQMYYLAVLSNGTLTYHWDDAAGASWIEIATGVTDALGNLDACYNEGYADKFVLASYRSTTNRVKVAMRAITGWEVDDIDDCIGETAIAAYGDIFIVVFLYDYANGPGIRYHVSYNAGITWPFGDIAEPTPAQVGFYEPEVTGRENGGFSVVYCQQSGGEPDPLWYVRRDYGVANWTAPEQINEVDVAVGWDQDISWIPPLPGGGSHAYGTLWTNNYPGYENYSFFQRSDGAIGVFSANKYTLDASTGGTVNLFLDAGGAKAFRNYLILGGVTGIEPGFNLPGGFATLPLNWDVFTDLVLSLLNTVVFQNFLGSLNGSGDGGATINAPSLPVSAVGVNLYFAYCLNAPYDFASNAISIKITP